MLLNMQFRINNNVPLFTSLNMLSQLQVLGLTGQDELIRILILVINEIDAQRLVL